MKDELKNDEYEVNVILSKHQELSISLSGEAKGSVFRGRFDMQTQQSL